MMEELTRAVTMERGGINLETGEFPMILATEGEAMDGHILSIKGMELPERMPLLFGHRSEIMAPSLGSITNLKRGKAEGVPILRGTGRINLEGDDPLADIRRGVAHLMHAGDLPAVSIRWDPIKTVPRTSLPEKHAARPTKKSPEVAQFGAFFEKSRALEGSIVAVGADPKALSGRADAATSELERVFWRTLARMESSGSEAIASVFQDLADVRSDLKDVGASDIDIVNLLLQETDMNVDLVPIEYGAGLRVHIPREAYQQLERELILLQEAKREEGKSKEELEDESQESRKVALKIRTVGDLSPDELIRGIAQGCAVTLGVELERTMTGMVERLTGRR